MTYVIAALLGVAEQKTDKGTFGGIIDRQCNDANLAPFKSPYDLEQLPDAVLQEHRELANRWVISTTKRCEIKARAVANAHSFVFGEDCKT